MGNIEINSMDPNWKKYAEAADKADRESDVGNFKNDKKLNLNSAFEATEFVRQAKADNKTEDQIREFFSSKGVKTSDINQIFQLELSISQAQQHTPDKKSIKRANNAVEVDVLVGIAQEGSRYYTKDNGTLKDTVDFAGIGQALVNYFSNPPEGLPNKEQYKKFAQEVQKVAELIQDEKYNSRDDINKLYAKVKGELDLYLPQDEMSDFRHEVLKKFVLLAERHQKEKEKQKLDWTYHELRVKHGKTREEAYKAIQKDPRFKGSYYESYDTPEYTDGVYSWVSKRDKQEAVTHNGLISEMENGIILEDARKEVYDAVWAQRGREGVTTSKQVEKEVEKLIKQDKYTDKIMHKNLRGEMSAKERLAMDRSEYKDLRKAVAAFNRVENNKVKPYSRDDFYHNAFKGKAGDYKFNQLTQNKTYVLDENGKPKKDKNGNPVMAEPLIKPRQAVDGEGKPMVGKDGKPVYLKDASGNPLYDISGLSDLIKSRISKADMRANYEDRSDPEAEIRTVVDDIKAATGVQISYTDACHLIDMCGFERDQWNVAYVIRTLEKAAVDTVSDMASAAVAAALVGAVQGDPLVHVEQAIFHTTDPTAHAVTNIDQITQALLGMSKSLGVVNPNNGVHLNIDWKINVTVNGESMDVGSGVDLYDMEEQLYTQLKQYKDRGVDFGVVPRSDGYYHLWIGIPSEASYEDIRGMAEILGKNFDLKTDTGVEFKADAVIDSKGEVVVDKEAEAKVDEKGKAEPTSRLKAFLLGTAIGFGLNVLRECLAGLPHTDKSIISTKIDKEDFESYARQLSSEPLMQANPRLKDAILAIAQLFQKDGKWDPRGYELFLRELAGGRSKLNKRELAFGILEYQKAHEPSLSIDLNKPVEPVVTNQDPTPIVEKDKKEVVPPAQSDGLKGIPIPHNLNESVSAKQSFTLEAEANYHFGQKHTWPGIAKAFYAECLQQGYTVKQIYTELKKVNGIQKGDNVIPQHLYLPEYLFGEGKGKKGNPTEAQVKAADIDPNYDPSKPIISHGTNIQVKRRPGGWIGIKTTNGDIKFTDEEYGTKEEAMKAAKDL